MSVEVVIGGKLKIKWGAASYERQNDDCFDDGIRISVWQLISE